MFFVFGSKFSSSSDLAIGTNVISKKERPCSIFTEAKIRAKQLKKKLSPGNYFLKIQKEKPANCLTGFLLSPEIKIYNRA